MEYKNLHMQLYRLLYKEIKKDIGGIIHYLFEYMWIKVKYLDIKGFKMNIGYLLQIHGQTFTSDTWKVSIIYGIMINLR